VGDGRLIGIDFGTTKTACAAWLDGSAQSLPGQRGRETTPSLVLMRRSGEVLVGWDAKDAGRRADEECVSIGSVKRKMGRAGESSWSWWKGYPQLVAAYVLAVARQCAERELGTQVDGAVIAVPAHFHAIQRRATLEAARIAGIQAVRVVNEATAAAIAYDHHSRPNQDRTTLVFDFGGGTLDVSVVTSGEGLYEVVAAAGDGSLGGDDFDELIAQHISDEQKKRLGGRKLIFGSGSKHELLALAEDVKKQLSSAQRGSLDIPGFVRQGEEYHDLHYELERSEFEALTAKLTTRARALLEAVIRESEQTPEAVVLVGGSSRIPCVREMVKSVVGRTPIVGAEHWVAHGAALLAGAFAGEIDSVVLLDVSPSTLSVGTAGGLATQLIMRNTVIPTEKTHTFTTTGDNQTAVDIMIYTGEGKLAGQNQVLGKVRLDVLPEARGVPKIDVTFGVGFDGMLQVLAKDRATGNSAEATVDSPYALNGVQLTRLSKQIDEWLATQLGPDLIAQLEALLRDNRDNMDVLHRDVVRKLEAVRDELRNSVSAAQIEKAQAEVAKVDTLLSIVRDIDATTAELCSAWRSEWKCLPMGPSQASELVRVEAMNGRLTGELAGLIKEDVDNYRRILSECSRLKRQARKLAEVSNQSEPSALLGEGEKWLALYNGSSPTSLDQAQALLVELKHAFEELALLFLKHGAVSQIPAEVAAITRLCFEHPETRTLMLEDSEWQGIRARVADSLQATAEKEDVSKEFLRTLRDLSSNHSVLVEVVMSSCRPLTRRHIFDLLREEAGKTDVSRLLTLFPKIEGGLRKPLLECLRSHGKHMTDTERQLLGYAEQWVDGSGLGMRRRLALKWIRLRAPEYADLVGFLSQKPRGDQAA